MKCLVFIATSFDGFIAKKDGDIKWLNSSGKKEVDLGYDSDMGFNSFISSIDCIIMGRKTLETLGKMNLSEEEWPYGSKRVIVLSKSLKKAPYNIGRRVEIYSGDLKNLLSKLEENGYCRVYIDGGATIRSFLKEKLIDEITVTRVPILIGDGIPLFDESSKDIKLEGLYIKSFANDYFQIRYQLKY